MKKLVPALAATFAALVLLAPTAKGGPRPDADPVTSVGASKALCKHHCMDASRSCRGKRTTCAAQRQQCLKACR